MRSAIPALVLAAVLGTHATAQTAQQSAPATKITELEIKTFINGHSGEDECPSLDDIYISHLEYFDFVGDGQQEALVVASTCMTGTAGPDVHAVYKRGADGKLVELPFLDKRGDPPFPNGRIPVFGNPNYNLAAENGELVVRFGDSSDREEPVVLCYKWDGAKFALDRKKIVGPFPTSYDCSKATKELDLAICYSPGVAALDVQMGQAFHAALQQLSAEQKSSLLAQQRDWLARREKECVIYKWWVECLTDLYTKRLAELKQT